MYAGRPPSWFHGPLGDSPRLPVNAPPNCFGHASTSQRSRAKSTSDANVLPGPTSVRRAQNDVAISCIA